MVVQESDRRPTPTRQRRLDPGRRDRIVDRCLDVIARVGVAGASHRVIAAEADVSLGSMTYYFDGLDDLLHEAFTRFASTVADRFDLRMGAVTDPSDARAAVVGLITRDVFGDERELVLTTELYTLAARDPSYRTITNGWMARSRAALERHFDPVTVRMLDPLIEGLTIHRALDIEPQDPAMVAEAVARITAAHL